LSDILIAIDAGVSGVIATLVVLDR